MFNDDKSGSFWKMAPDRTISSHSIIRRRKQNSKFTFMYCCKADGYEKISFSLERAIRHCISTIKAQKTSAFAIVSRKALYDIFTVLRMIIFFDDYIGQKGSRRVLLLRENCLAKRIDSFSTKPAICNRDIYSVEHNVPFAATRYPYHS